MDDTAHWPPYAYRPGRHPHPRRDPRGHSHAAPEPDVGPLDAGPLGAHPAWRHAWALFDASHWWESHEWLEALWRALGPGTIEGRLMKALVQIAAGQLRRAVGSEAGAQRLWRRAAGELAALPDRVADVRVRDLAAALERTAGDPDAKSLTIPMAGTAEPPSRSATAGSRPVRDTS